MRPGVLQLDPQIIKVRADNGFGRMVTRRRDQHCERVNSMPDPAEKGPQGIYYHVSFYDLQAANHITMLPNSVDFVNRELQQVLQNGGRDFWIINCSNVKPHVYMLDAIRKIWWGKPYRMRAIVRHLFRRMAMGMKRWRAATGHIRRRSLPMGLTRTIMRESSCIQRISGFWRMRFWWERIGQAQWNG